MKVCKGREGGREKIEREKGCKENETCLYLLILNIEEEKNASSSAPSRSPSLASGTQSKIYNR